MRQASSYIKGTLQRLSARCDAATSAEYALLIAMIAIVIVVAVGVFGQQVAALFRSYPTLISS